MRVGWVGLSVGLVAIGLSLAFAPAPDEAWTVIVGGDTRGNLAPCGCSLPMTGGIRRKATAVRSLTVPNRTVYLENGPLSDGLGRQAEMKAETMAEILADLKAGAINLAHEDASLGPGAVASIARLSGGRLISGSLRESPTNPLPSNRAVGPFLVGGVSVAASRMAPALRERTVPTDGAVRALVAEAEQAGLRPVLMLDGPLAEAQRLARAFPTFALVVYRLTADPPPAPIMVGNVWLVTPGEKGKHLVRLRFDGAFSRYAVVSLGSEVKDDPDASRRFETYLDRVRREKLMAVIPRERTPLFAGNKVCASCHSNADRVWRKSAHAGALRTLERERHDADPDCVGCHVVGLHSASGFRSRAKTPQLTDVGCESCHGPGLAHAKSPTKVKMPKRGPRACAPCHVPDHSPGFDYAKYWGKIRH
ncbi:MAG: hypothetical protein KIS66_13075 [Fimbriimonadaceae bacterium]|nr:hypothetical protein [Fimbriimonadaceae bacterium]